MPNCRKGVDLVGRQERPRLATAFLSFSVSIGFLTKAGQSKQRIDSGPPSLSPTVQATDIQKLREDSATDDRARARPYGTGTETRGSNATRLPCPVLICRWAASSRETTKSR